MSTWIKGVPPKMAHDIFGVYHGQWMPEMDRCWIRKEDGVCVCSRLLRTAIGKVEHVTITRSPDNHFSGKAGDFAWAEKQQIKNELFGTKRAAVEVFPSADRLIDVMDVYHLWVFEKGYQLPFGIHPKEYQKAINRGYGMSPEELRTLQEFYTLKSAAGTMHGTSDATQEEGDPGIKQTTKNEQDPVEQREEYIKKSHLLDRFKARLNASNEGSMAEAYYAACLDILDTEKGIYLTTKEQEVMNEAV